MENQVVHTYQDLYKLTLNKNNIIMQPNYGNKFRTENKIITINGINIKNVCDFKVVNEFDSYINIFLLDDKNHIVGNLTLYNNQSLIESYNIMLDVYTYSIQTD